MVESEEELDSVDESSRGEWKLNIQKTKILASGLITLWKVDGETMETVTDFIYLFIYFWSPKPLHMMAAAMKLKDPCSLEENLWPT